MGRKTCNPFGILFLFSLLVFSAAVLLFRVPSAESAESREASVDLVTAIQKVAKQNIPAVVHIEVTERQEIANPLLPYENNPFFHYFFGSPKNMPKKFQREVQGIGSGMIMDAEGHILTNNHVVGGANKIQVVLADGREFTEKSVKLIGTDPKTDLAVIQITSKEALPHVNLGDSDKVGVGQWVVAIGHPRGLDQTVTQGIISAMHRRGIEDPSGYQDFLQTDAAINPGNSGGPLLNLDGEVIGVNAAIMSQSGGFEGIGFAIPSNMALHVAKELIANGKVVRGWLGLSIQDLTPALAQSFGLGDTKGALVADVVKGGPADTAGIKRGDVVASFQDKPVVDSSTFRNDVALAPIGKDAKVTVIRNGTRQEISVKVGSQEEQQKMLAAALKQKLGVAVRPATPQELTQYGVNANEGVVITEVDPKSSLGKAGLEADDIILQIDRHPVGGPDSLSAVLSTLAPNQTISVLVIDHKSGQIGYLDVTL